jgi:translocation and assembly module TamA
MQMSRCLILSLALFSIAVNADVVEYSVAGVDEPMATNVLRHLSDFRFGSSAEIDGRLRRSLVRDAERAVRNAVRPFGYFNPDVTVDIRATAPGEWLLTVQVAAGPPVRVVELRLGVVGPGKDLDALREWRLAFPVTEGKRLDQQAWDQAKQDALELLEEAGFIRAGFTRHVINVDPVANTANLELELDTGPQAVIGDVTFNQHVLDDGVLDRLQRLQRGDPYGSWLLEKFRLDLWLTGYFEDVEIVERRELAADPPRVDLVVNAQARKPHTFQTTLGFGTDTLIRGQLVWDHHLLSPRGDNFDAGLGWQQYNEEFTLQANYRLPRKTPTRQFWLASPALHSVEETLKVSESGDVENRLDIARGTINDISVRLGRTRVHNIRRGYQQLFETVFVEHLYEDRDLYPTGNLEAGGTPSAGTRILGNLLTSTSSSTAFGLDVDWPEIRGAGYYTTGHHQRAWMFTSNEAWGSDVGYSQLYLSSRWNFLLGDRWKILLRGEAGYSDATTSSLEVPTTGGDLNISVTELPNRYRFKAGGSRSVRGYAFESLDDNGLGSNNVVTASAELEYRLHEKWGVAVFLDAGNAFNDWNDMDLKLGAGAGIRWYTVIGALRLDMAQGRNLDGDPWRIHLTIGTPLL